MGHVTMEMMYALNYNYVSEQNTVPYYSWKQLTPPPFLSTSTSGAQLISINCQSCIELTYICNLCHFMYTVYMTRSGFVAQLLRQVLYLNYPLTL